MSPHHDPTEFPEPTYKEAIEGWQRCWTALEAIARMHVDDDTDHAQLSALCIAKARVAIGKAPDGLAGGKP